MGFEIGNHSWTHDGFSIPRNADRLAGEFALIEFELKRVGIPKPISFAYCGNAFGPEAVKMVQELGYKLARRGITPEVEYEFGTDHLGPAFHPLRHHPLVIPSTGIPDPFWTLAHFERSAGSGNPKTTVGKEGSHFHWSQRGERDSGAGVSWRPSSAHRFPGRSDRSHARYQSQRFLALGSCKLRSSGRSRGHLQQSWTYLPGPHAHSYLLERAERGAGEHRLDKGAGRSPALSPETTERYRVRSFHQSQWSR